MPSLKKGRGWAKDDSLARGEIWWGLILWSLTSSFPKGGESENPILFGGETKKSKETAKLIILGCVMALRYGEAICCMLVPLYAWLFLSSKTVTKKPSTLFYFFSVRLNWRNFDNYYSLLLKQGFLSQSQTIKILCSRFLTKTVQHVSYMPFKPKPNHQNTLFEIPY